MEETNSERPNNVKPPSNSSVQLLLHPSNRPHCYIAVMPVSLGNGYCSSYSVASLQLSSEHWHCHKLHKVKLHTELVVTELVIVLTE
jgi:hypothetical protein